MKKFLAFILATLMLFSLAACKGNNGNSSEVATDAPLTKDDVIQIAISSHASWPYNENWKVWEYIEEGCGATLDVIAIPASDVITKYSLMLISEDTIPDIMSYSSMPNDKYVQQGTFIAFDDVEEYMPNYNAWLETLSDDERKINVQSRTSYDGKVYFSRKWGTNTKNQAKIERKRAEILRFQP